MNVIKGNKKVKIIIFSILVLLIFSLSVINLNSGEEITINVNSNSVSNRKIGWGIKRDNLSDTLN